MRLKSLLDEYRNPTFFRLTESKPRDAIVSSASSMSCSNARSVGDKGAGTSSTTCKASSSSVSQVSCRGVEARDPPCDEADSSAIDGVKPGDSEIPSTGVTILKGFCVGLNAADCPSRGSEMTAASSTAGAVASKVPSAFASWTSLPEGSSCSMIVSTAIEFALDADMEGSKKLSFLVHEGDAEGRRPTWGGIRNGGAKELD